MLARKQQIDATFDPNDRRRLWRTWRNAYDTLRDAFARAFSHVLGQVIRQSDNKALAQSQKDVDTVGREILAAAGDAYEPMLESHIGCPVVVELEPPGGGAKRIEMTGYLADYTEHFIALFNVEHDHDEPFKLALEPDVEPEMPDGISIERAETHLLLTNSGRDFLVVRSLSREGQAPQRLGATLIPGSSVRVARPDVAVTVELRRVRAVDLVCPRQHATVRYAGPRPDAIDRDGVSPLHRDESVEFP